MMEKALIALLLSAFNVADLIFGPGWWSYPTEESLGVLANVLTPILVWLVPNGWLRWSR